VAYFCLMSDKVALHPDFEMLLHFVKLDPRPGTAAPERAQREASNYVVFWQTEDT